MKQTIVGLLLFLICASQAAAQTPYFQGKTIRVVVGYPAGSAHDLWARLIAPQLTKHIPGNPTTIVQNMPGAGSMTATNYIYGVSKPDGLTLGVNNAALYFEQLLKKKEVQYDWAKFTWVGGTTRTSPLLYMWANTPYKTIHDVRTAAVPPKCGATGTGNTGYYLPRLLEETIGAKFQFKLSQVMKAARVSNWPWSAAKCSAAPLPSRFSSAENRSTPGAARTWCGFWFKAVKSATRACRKHR